MEGDFITTREAMAMLGCSRPTVHKMLHDGRLEGIRLAKVYRVRRQSVLDCLRARGITPPVVTEAVSVGREHGSRSSDTGGKD